MMTNTKQLPCVRLLSQWDRVNIRRVSERFKWVREQFEAAARRLHLRSDDDVSIARQYVEGELYRWRQDLEGLLRQSDAIATRMQQRQGGAR